jgi:uncharacterized protein with FMN-binding domain
MDKQILANLYISKSKGKNMVHRSVWLFLLTLSLFIGCAAVNMNIVGGPILTNSLKDGVYDGKAKVGPVRVLARVTIQNQRIIDISLLEHRSLKGRAAEDIIPHRIIDEQSTKVDAVSGATVSSTAIMNAVDDAVQMAK